MANASEMGPPLSPRETRRSGRRSAQSASASSSKSPDSPVSESAANTPAHPPRPSRENSGHGRRPSLSSHNSNGRSKRLKQEDIDEGVGEDSTSNGTAGTATNGRGRRKVKDKNSGATDIVVDDAAGGDHARREGAPAEEEPSVTRCVCGSTGE